MGQISDTERCQRELYSMGNTGLLRPEAEMTLLQPQLGETRHHELRNSPFWHSSLFKSQLVKEGEDFLLKKGTSKDSKGFGPFPNKPFRGSHKKRGSYRKRPYGGNSSINRFPQAEENPASEALEVVFDPTTGDEGVETLPPNDSSIASQSTSRRSPPFFQKRLENKQLFIKHVKHYHQWLRTAIPLKTKAGQISSDSVLNTRPFQKTKLWPIVSSLFCQRTP